MVKEESEVVLVIIFYRNFVDLKFDFKIVIFEFNLVLLFFFFLYVFLVISIIGSGKFW